MGSSRFKSTSRNFVFGTPYCHFEILTIQIEKLLYGVQRGIFWTIRIWGAARSSMANIQQAMGPHFFATLSIFLNFEEQIEQRVPYTYPYMVGSSIPPLIDVTLLTFPIYLSYPIVYILG